jgi:hypothetical protein
MKLTSLLFIVVSAFAFIGLFECRSFAQEEKVVINVQEMGTKIGVPGEEMVLPGGQKRLRQTWQVEDVEKVISELQYCSDSPETTYLITEIAEPWMTLALLDALRPLKVKYLYPNPSIGTELEMYNLKRGEQSPNYDVKFEVFLEGDNVYINLTSDRSDAKEAGHTFDLENLSKVAIPEIPAGKHVFIHAKGMYGVMVCIANNYVKNAKSLSIGCHDSDYICAVSKTDGLKLGDVTPRKRENNL